VDAGSASARGVEAGGTASVRTRPIGPGAALILALGSAVAFAASDAIGPLRDDLDHLFLLAGLVGWILLGGAILVVALACAALIGRMAGCRPVARLEFALLAGAVTLVVLEAGLHPLWGAGGGSGG
jgi:hypothetical protein